MNRPSDGRRLADEVNHPHFKILFDTSHAYTGAVAGARQGPDPELLAGGVVEYARLLADHLSHLHLIDSDGWLHDEDQCSSGFRSRASAFQKLLAALPRHGLALDWWTVDFCFSATPEGDGRLATAYVQPLRDSARAAIGAEL